VDLLNRQLAVPAPRFREQAGIDVDAAGVVTLTPQLAEECTRSRTDLENPEALPQHASIGNEPQVGLEVAKLCRA
jgi:hypothetical protein